MTEQNNPVEVPAPKTASAPLVGLALRVLLAALAAFFFWTAWTGTKTPARVGDAVVAIGLSVLSVQLAHSARAVRRNQNTER